MENLNRILIINYEFPPLGGGAGHASAQVAREMVRQGFAVSVMTSWMKGLKNKEEIDGYTVYRMRAIRRFREKSCVFEMMVFLVASLFSALRVSLKTKPQVVVSFFSIPCGPAALLLKILFNIPYIVSLRGGDVPGFLPEQLKPYHKISNWLTRWIWKKAAFVTACSQGLADLANGFSSGQKIIVIPNGVDEDYFFHRSQKETVHPGCHAVLRILSVGRLAQQKKTERLIESIRRLVKNGFDAIRLVIVGDGPLRAFLEEQAERAGLLNTSVFFTGWIDRSQIFRYYREADVFAMASDFEGMPNVVLEALASSLAVVATEAAGTVELVEDHVNGVIVPLQQLECFDQAFRQLHENRDLLKKYQEKSYEKSQSYSWAKTAAGYLALCQAAIHPSEEA